MTSDAPPIRPPGPPDQTGDGAEPALLARNRRSRPADPLLSLIVPVRNEAATVAPFLAAVEPVLDRMGLRTELVFVNDGSTDPTFSALLDLQRRDDRIRVVNLSRSFGKEAAVSAGLAVCSGEIVVPIDVDLQDPPELLVDFVSCWHQGYDVVYGVRRNRDGDPLAVRLTARLFYWTFNRLSPQPIPADVGDFRLLDRRVVDAVLALPERNRVLKGLFAWVGYPTTGVAFDRPPRSAGTSAWSMRRRGALAVDAITGFSSAPLRMWTWLGLLIAVAAACYGLCVLGLALSGATSGVPGYASLLLTVLFLGALQLVSLGLLGEYLARVLTETKGRPLYVIEGLYGPRDEPAPRRRPGAHLDGAELFDDAEGCGSWI